jgi:hypothetical protein
MVTFGNKVTIENTVKDFSKLKVDKYHICNEKIKGAGKFIEWNHKIFIDILKDFDCAILSNRKHWTADLKSNNRLLVCMAIGLPVMALNMPAYSEILMREEFYEGELLFDSTPEDTFKFLSNYSVRNHLNQVMPEYAFENYGPDKSAKKLYEVFKEYGN